MNQTASRALLQARGLIKRFGGFTALQGIDFDLMDRERVRVVLQRFEQ